MFPCPCCSRAHVASVPMLLPCPCCSRAHVPMPMLILCPCAQAHVDLLCPCSHACVYSMLVYIPCPCSFHAHIYTIPMFISSPCHMCLPHHHVYHMLMFNCMQIVSCINIKRSH